MFVADVKEEINEEIFVQPPVQVDINSYELKFEAPRLVNHQEKHDNSFPNAPAAAVDVTKENSIDPNQCVQLIQKVYECTVCGLQYTNINSFKRHMNIHTDKFKCDKCHQRFMSPWYLKNHNCDQSPVINNEQTLKYSGQSVSRDAGSSELKYQCDQCDRKFTTKAILSQHKVTHTDRYRCQTCRKGFVNAKLLTIHVKNPRNCEKHLRNNPIVKTLTKESNENLKLMNQEVQKQASIQAEGRNQHQTKFKYSCDKCDKKFASRYGFTCHQVSHTDKYKCYHCEKTFSRSKFLEIHQKNVKNCEKHISMQKNL